MRRLVSAVPGRVWAWFMVGGAIVLGSVLSGAPTPDNPAPVSTTGLSSDWQSTQVEQIAEQLPSSTVQPAIIVVSRRNGAVLTPEDITGLTQRSAELARFAVGGQIPPPRVSADRTVALLTVPVSARDGDAALTDTVGGLRAAVDSWPETLRVAVTGGPAFTADLKAVFEGADITLLIATASVVALLLLITYRSPLLWILPLAVVAAAEQLTLKASAIVVPAAGIHLDDGATTGIASVLVFGAATDYALLLIARYREELRREADRFVAMARALRRTVEPVLASGGTVILAVLTLLLSERESHRALGLACAVGVLFAVAAALLVLPAALVLSGRGVFWPFVPRVGDVGREGRIWGRLGDVVAGRPTAVALGSIVVLAAMASGMLGLRTGLSETEQFRVKPEAVLGAQTLAGAFPAGTTQPATILTSESAAETVAAAAATVRGVDSVVVAERAGGSARLDVVLTHEAGTAESDRTLRDLRAAVARVPDSAPAAAGTRDEPVVPGTAIVGGTVGAALDTKDADGQDRWVILPAILLLVGAVLLLLLRSALAPVLLVGTVIASFFASLGLSWLMFDQVLNFPAMDPDVILLAFVFLVALGVDYNIFLVTRAREDAAISGTRQGMRSALRVTGGVITSAGILLAAVFAVLGVLPLITLTQIGIIVCVGVLLDTLLVRTVLVPALAFRLGDRFWWPSRPAPADSPVSGR
ncbi:MAG: MMPL family transporter [Dactylosporangium sp.]|nr:MMPL family transporter [Dactylosporangium sp.]NNJ63377.1 MMPL family transporter [Dactylosporangium sp.]